MMQFILYITSLASSIMFMQMKHPLAMGLMLLIQSLLVCLITGLMFNSFWYAYILFLIFLGGLLILFIYVTSLASNEMFSFSMKMFSLSMLTITMLMMTMKFMDSSLTTYMFMNDNMMMLDNNMNYMLINNLSLMNLYNFPNNLVTIMLMNYLLLTLIAVVKITNLFYGPLRPMN